MTPFPVLLVLGLSAALSVSVDAALAWELETGGAADSAFELAWGDDRFVLVSESGEIATSTDAEDWAVVRAADDEALQGLAFGAGRFLASGAQGKLLSSTDGSTWTSETSGTSDYISGLVFAEGRWVAVGGSTTGAGGFILTSDTEGVWVARDAGGAPWMAKVAYGNGVFIAVGQGGTILRSEDGSSWSPAVSGITSYLSRVAFGGGRFVAVGQRGRVLHSPDGIVWTVGGIGTRDWMHAAVYAGGTWLVAGELGVASTSSDLVNWDDAGVGAGGDLTTYGAIRGGDLLVLAGSPSEGEALVARAEVVDEPVPDKAPPLSIRIVPGEGGTGERIALGYLLPTGGSIWSGVTIYSTEDLEDWQPLGVAPQLVSTTVEGQRFEAVDPRSVTEGRSRGYRAEFLP